MSVCGTLAGYSAHKKQHSTVCDQCRAVYREWHRSWRARGGTPREPHREIPPDGLHCAVCDRPLAGHVPFGPCYQTAMRGVAR